MEKGDVTLEGTNEPQTLGLLTLFPYKIDF